VLALGRKDTGEPLNSEDTALLAAVAGQIATALENARLYRQLHLKALELDRLRAFNENILESLDDGLLVVDLNDRVVRWNSALEKLYGVTRDEAAGVQLHALFDAAFVEAIRAARRDSPDGATLSRIPLTGRGAAEGSRLLVNAAVVPLRAAHGGATVTVGTIVIIEDITSRVHLEEQLQISEKMASIGLLAAGVAHEVNTPLTGISSFTQMLLDGADPNDQRTRLLEKIERQTFRAAKIVNSLLNLSRPAASGSTDRSQVDLNAVVTDVLSLLEHQFEIGNIKVRRELSTDPPLVLGAEHKLQQVFLNLFLNARDAMPKGGWLSITTRVHGGRVMAEEPRLRRSGRYRLRHPCGAVVAHLRSVFHDQRHREGNWPRPLDHVRHRPGARRLDQVRERCRRWHAVHSRIPDGAGHGARAARRGRRARLEGLQYASEWFDPRHR
jgi:PAS domain S-box-containing protein